MRKTKDGYFRLIFVAFISVLFLVSCIPTKATVITSKIYFVDTGMEKGYAEIGQTVKLMLKTDVPIPGYSEGYFELRNELGGDPVVYQAQKINTTTYEADFKAENAGQYKIKGIVRVGNTEIISSNELTLIVKGYSQNMEPDLIIKRLKYSTEVSTQLLDPYEPLEITADLSKKLSREATIKYSLYFDGELIHERTLKGTKYKFPVIYPPFGEHEIMIKTYDMDFYVEGKAFKSINVDKANNFSLKFQAFKSENFSNVPLTYEATVGNTDDIYFDFEVTEINDPPATYVYTLKINGSECASAVVTQKVKIFGPFKLNVGENSIEGIVSIKTNLATETLTKVLKLKVFDTSTFDLISDLYYIRNSETFKYEETTDLYETDKFFFSLKIDQKDLSAPKYNYQIIVDDKEILNFEGMQKEYITPNFSLMPGIRSLNVKVKREDTGVIKIKNYTLEIRNIDSNMFDLNVIAYYESINGNVVNENNVLEVDKPVFIEAKVDSKVTYEKKINYELCFEKDVIQSVGSYNKDIIFSPIYLHIGRNYLKVKVKGEDEKLNIEKYIYLITEDNQPPYIEMSTVAGEEIISIESTTTNSPTSITVDATKAVNPSFTVIFRDDSFIVEPGEKKPPESINLEVETIYPTGTESVTISLGIDMSFSNLLPDFEKNKKVRYFGFLKGVNLIPGNKYQIRIPGYYISDEFGNELSEDYLIPFEVVGYK